MIHDLRAIHGLLTRVFIRNSVRRTWAAGVLPCCHADACSIALHKDCSIILRMRVSLFNFCTLALLVAAPLHAEPALDDQYSLKLFFVETRLESLLAEISERNDLRLDLDKAASGVLTDFFFEGTDKSLIKFLSAEFNLDVFTFNKTLHVSGKPQSTTRIINFPQPIASEAIDSLRASGFPVDWFPYNVSSDDRTVTMSGPPKYLAIAETLFDSFVPGAVAAPATITIRRGVEVFQSPVMGQPPTKPEG